MTVEERWERLLGALRRHPLLVLRAASCFIRRRGGAPEPMGPERRRFMLLLADAGVLAALKDAPVEVAYGHGVHTYRRLDFRAGAEALKTYFASH